MLTAATAKKKSADRRVPTSSPTPSSSIEARLLGSRGEGNGNESATTTVECPRKEETAPRGTTLLHELAGDVVDGAM